MAATTTLRSRLLSAGLTLAVLASGCGGEPRRDDPEVGIYAAAIRWLVEDRWGDAEGPFEEPVYVETIGADEDIPLEIQAGVVERLEDFATVRFIDAREEAVETSKPRDPIRGEGLLVGLGPVPPGQGTPVRLYADRYTDVEDVVAYELVIERAEGGWRVAGRPEPVNVRNRAPTPHG